MSSSLLVYQWCSRFYPPHVSYGQVRTFLRNTSNFVSGRVGYVLCNVVARFVDEDDSRKLNASFRGKDYPTNVLTFSYQELGDYYADIVLCVPVVREESIIQNKILRDHYAHLLVHGFLHAYGFDHENDHDAEVMEDLERQILYQMSFPDPRVG
ncbi:MULTISPECIES: rRNA maturation RNase YbeY [Candidatus Ichthyocystis]|uniref:rRNA maturation RNase YbeY n=1 Tax=Candidatus Ichthyocystis TaxID=2929841 RepID=UPI000B248F81|nr:MULTISPECIES: rRNA maturation RNase YbeY [Ichthyocystis]